MKLMAIDMYCWVSLDACPFYPEGGGQVSDRGEVRILAGVLEGVVFEVLGATKTQPGLGRSNDIALLLKYASEYQMIRKRLDRILLKGHQCTPVFQRIGDDRMRRTTLQPTSCKAGLRNMFGPQITQADRS